jgi:hypothetical protein
MQEQQQQQGPDPAAAEAQLCFAALNAYADVASAECIGSLHVSCLQVESKAASSMSVHVVCLTDATICSLLCARLLCCLQGAVSCYCNMLLRGLQAHQLRGVCALQQVKQQQQQQQQLSCKRAGSLCR